MSISPEDCCVLNSGNGSWAFDALAKQLGAFIGISISETPRRFNYLLCSEGSNEPPEPLQASVFIPWKAVRLASDKRLLAERFVTHGIPIPETHLLETFEEVLNVARAHTDKEWCLKYPTSCGANGHRLVTSTSTEPPNWPKPFVLQEFVRLEHPEVYRAFSAGGELFGWVARRFPDGAAPSPWVAHARGARYVNLGQAPAQACEAARKALVATELWESFGCADLLQKPTGEWVVLEVGTDGMFNHVDRDLGCADLEGELHQRIAGAFWKAAERVSAKL